MTILNTKDTERVLGNTFSIEFLRAKLTQKRDEMPVVYTGPASVTQQSDGNLSLKLYHLYESPAELLKEVNTEIDGGALKLGKIIEDYHYFDFEGVDLFGAKWTSTHIWVSGDVSFPSSGKVVTAKLKKIENIAARAVATSTVQLYIPGNFRIPYYKGEQRENSFGLHACELTINGRLCTLRKQDSHLEIIADLKGEPNPDDYLDLILEALGIGIGYHLRPHLKIANHLGRRIQVIYSRATDDRQLKLPPPIPTSYPHNAKNLQDFVDKFIHTITESNSPLAGYWFRVLQAFSGEVENSALVLTTAIEGLLRNYHSAIGIPDEEFIKQLNDAEKLINGLPLEKRVKNRIISTLSNAKAASPKNSLYALVGTGLISEDLVSLWKKLRNKSAHADELRFETHELQAFIDELHGCLELFYRLILGEIEYSGEILQYSVSDWPETKLNAGNKRGQGPLNCTKT